MLEKRVAAFDRLNFSSVPLNAFAFSAMVVFLLIALEYIAIVWVRPDSFENPFGSEVIDFAVSDNGQTGVFVVADHTTLDDRLMSRHRTGFVDMRRGKLSGDLLATASTPKRVTTCDGQLGLFVGCRDGSIACVNSRSEKNQRVHSGIQTAPALNDLLFARENRIVIVRHAGLIVARQADTGTRLWQRHFEGTMCVAIDRPGRSLYCALPSGEVVQVDSVSGRPKRVCAQLDQAVVLMTVSPCGEYLATVGMFGQLVNTRLIDGAAVWEGRAMCTVKPAFSLDSTRLIVSDAETDGRLLVVDTHSGDRLFSLGRHKGALGVCCSVDGHAYSWGNDGCIKAWDLGRRQLRWLIRPANQGKTQQAVLSMATGAFTP